MQIQHRTEDRRSERQRMPARRRKRTARRTSEGAWVSKKDAKGSYDPQVGRAAAQSAATAAEAQKWAENYQTQYIAPLLKQMTDASTKNQANLDNLYSLNAKQLQTSIDRYGKYGIPAEDAYYKMVNDYSSPDYAASQAEAALGDQRTAEAAQLGSLKRNFGSYGINLNSPAAVAAMSDMAVKNAAAEAHASTAARTAARNLGMKLKSDAANFGRGGQSSILSFGGAAQGNTNSSVGNSVTALNGGVSGASVPMSGFQTALSGQNAVLNAYSNLDSNSINANAQNSSGFGQAIGTVLGAAAGNSKLFGGGA